MIAVILLILRAKSLHEGDGTRPGRLVCIACFFDQMRGNNAMDDAQHATHDLGPAGEQETHGVRVIITIRRTCSLIPFSYLEE